MGQYSSLETGEHWNLKIAWKSPKREDIHESSYSSPKKFKNKMSKGNFESQEAEDKSLDESKWYNMSWECLAFHDLV